MLDAVPFSGAGRQMEDADGEAGFVGEALQLAFPEAHPDTIAAAAISRDGETSRLGIAHLAEPLPPPPDALDRKGGRVAIDPDVDPARVGGNVCSSAISAPRRRWLPFAS